MVNDRYIINPFNLHLRNLLQIKGIVVRNIFFFDSMVTPKIITFVYWISLFAVAVSGLMTIFFTHQVLGGILAIVLGGLGVRVGFELVIIAFKNNEYLKKIAEKS